MKQISGNKFVLKNDFQYIRDELDISMLLGWNSALNSSNEQERQLAEDLVLYSLINPSVKTIFSYESLLYFLNLLK